VQTHLILPDPAYLADPDIQSSSGGSADWSRFQPWTIPARASGATIGHASNPAKKKGDATWTQSTGPPTRCSNSLISVAPPPFVEFAVDDVMLYSLHLPS